MAPCSLLEALQAVPDHRRSNRCYPLAPVLTLAVCAMLCGARSVLAIGEWGRRQGPELLGRLGLGARGAPGPTMLHYLFRRLDVDAFEATLTAWLEAHPATHALPSPVLGFEPVAFDGKVLCGTQNHPDAPGLAVVSAFALGRGLVLGQAVQPGGDERAAARALADALPLAGRVVTADALHANAAFAAAIGKKTAPICSSSSATPAGSIARSTRTSRAPRQRGPSRTTTA
jgi:DDE family transposase